MYRSVNFIAYHICNISMTYPRISMHNNRYPQMKQGDIMKVYASKRNLIWWCNLMQIAITHNCDFHAAYNCISFMLWTFVILNLTKQLEISISFLMYNDNPFIVYRWDVLITKILRIYLYLMCEYSCGISPEIVQGCNNLIGNPYL